MAQSHAGYFIEELMPLLTREAESDRPGNGRKKLLSLLCELNYFEIKASNSLEGHGSKLESLLAVAGSLMARGLPALTPLKLSAHLLRQLW